MGVVVRPAFLTHLLVSQNSQTIPFATLQFERFFSREITVLDADLTTTHNNPFRPFFTNPTICQVLEHPRKEVKTGSRKQEAPARNERNTMGHRFDPPTYGLCSFKIWIHSPVHPQKACSSRLKSRRPSELWRCVTPPSDVEARVCVVAGNRI